MDEAAEPIYFNNSNLNMDEVYRNVRLRYRNLRELRVLSKKSTGTSPVVGSDVTDLKLDHMSQSALSRDDTDLPVQETQADISKAQEWVNDLLTCHSTIFTRERYAILLQSAVAKDLLGQQERWTEVETFYMLLTNLNVSDPKKRLYCAVMMAHERDLATRLDNMRRLAREKYDAQQRASKLDDDMKDVRIKIVEQTRDIKIDHFACAVPIGCLTSRSDVLDQNEGSCPVCQNSYIDLSANTAAELLADGPVRIKYCGHIIGKACLEQWMSTPKIEEAKYPHRTCPLCRVKIEGRKAPTPPKSLKAHIKNDRRAIETLRELVYGWDMDMEECMETITRNMSEEIACDEVLNLINSLPDKVRQGHDNDAKMLRDKMEKLKAERWVWGLKGDRAWMQMRDEWMESGVVRKA